ncbi:MAG: cellulose biosynthesis cyclic di-GMP-binding regulatory protein BcsB [Cellulosilyticaceae bacterium]
MKHIRILIFILCSIIGFIKVPILAKENYEINFSKDYQVDALFGKVTENFYISEKWDIKAINMKLLFSNSPIINKDLSSITLSINNHYFYTTFIPESTMLIKTLDIVIPIEYIKEGLNSLDIDTYMRISDDKPCSDDATIANWFTVDKQSSIAITYDVNKQYDSIAEFYERFIDVDTLRNKQSAIAISNQNDRDEMQAGIIGLLGISGERLDKENIIKIFPMDNREDIKGNHIIYISLYDNLMPNIKNTISSEIVKQLQDKVYLKLLEAPGGSHILTITSKNGDLLKQTVKILGNKELMIQYKKSENIIGYDNTLRQEKLPKEEIKELTNAGEYLKGSFRQQKEFYINYPKSRSVTQGSNIYLRYRYAENLDFDRSLVTIYINDQPIGSRKLTKEKANKDEVTLSIPTDLNISGNFNVKVAFDLEQKDLWCTVRNNDTPWAYISKESMIKIYSKEQPFMLFENYPYPFVKDNDINDLAIVIPDKPEAYIYEAISNITNMLGNFVSINGPNIEVKMSSQLDEIEKEKNIIAIGTFNQNEFIKNLNPKLFFKFNSTGETLVSNEKIEIDKEYGKELGTLQFLRSPYNYEKGVMVVTGANGIAVVDASINISKEDKLWKLYGDGMIVDSEGNIKNYRFKKENDKEIPVIEEVLRRKDISLFLISSILVIALVISIIGFIIRKYSRKS